MENKINGSLLLDFYSSFLTDKQRQVMNLYLECDTSLSEIANDIGASRQAVYDIVKTAESVLSGMESKLKLVEKYLENSKLLNACLINLEQLKNEKNAKLVQNTEEIVKKTLNNL